LNFSVHYDRLEEMQEYCETKGECRRRLFHNRFGSSGQIFKKCGNMCDNCRGKEMEGKRGEGGRKGEGRREGGKEGVEREERVEWI
jgi:superfamily II DNA helicase RecQ